MNKKIILLMIVSLVTLVIPAQVLGQNDWQATIRSNYQGQQCTCIVGEKQTASDGVDSYDVPHPPFFPPGRCFIFCIENSFPDPYKTLWYEYKKQPDTHKIFNFTAFLMNSNGGMVTIRWLPGEFRMSEYKTVQLKSGDVVVSNMKKQSNYSFYSNAYQMTFFTIECNI